MPGPDSFDVIVIGAGPVGENVAERAVRGGLTAVIVESELVGGECSYWACMPSKALLRPGQALAEARAVAGSREAVSGQLAVAAVLDRRDSFTSHWDDAGQVQWLDGVGVTLARGHGRLVGPKRVDVEGSDGDGEGDGTLRSLTAVHAVVISTGSVASLPPVDGLADVAPWTPREATSAKAPPERLVVLGGGVVGCEMAQAWTSLGSQVIVVEVAPRILAGNEPFASELVSESMAEQGIEVLTGIGVTSVQRADDGTVTTTLADGRTIDSNEILVAAGRRPATQDIGLQTVGLVPGSWLTVDDTLLVQGVEGEWLYATGDVNHRALLTHQGKYQARACGDVIAARAKGDVVVEEWGPYTASADHAAVPGIVFTDPEVASVGLTEERARATGLVVKVVDYQIGQVAGASLFADEYKGQARIVVDEQRRVIVGATFVGPGVAELLHSATVAVVGEVPIDRLWHAVPSYPAISEVWLRLLETYGL
jgi:dihydrolipoamide dehydrogenase